MEITQVVLTVEEISELRRLAGDDRFAQWSKVYEVAKTGLVGEEAIKKANEELDPANHIDRKTYDAILRAFRERSVTLRIQKDLVEVHPFIVKLNEKIQDMIAGITKEKIDKARLVEVTTGIGTLIDKVRLLEGRSTQNIENHIRKSPDALAAATTNMKKLREDFDRLVAFAQQHGMELPKDEAFLQKMRDTGEVFSYGEENNIIPKSDADAIDVEAEIVDNNAANA